jgi:hypothetical protein
MPRKKKNPEPPPAPYTLESVLALIQEWLEIRRIRDFGFGSRHASNAYLYQMPGKHTSFEGATEMLNILEEKAELAFTEWRELLELGSFELDAGNESKPRDLSGEVLEFYEMLRVVRNSGDKDLIKRWLSERSWSEKLLIPLLLNQKPTGKTITF